MKITKYHMYDVGLALALIILGFAIGATAVIYAVNSKYDCGPLDSKYISCLVKQ